MVFLRVKWSEIFRKKVVGPTSFSNFINLPKTPAKAASLAPQSLQPILAVLATLAGGHGPSSRTALNLPGAGVKSVLSCPCRGVVKVCGWGRAGRVGEFRDQYAHAFYGGGEVGQVEAVVSVSALRGVRSRKVGSVQTEIRQHLAHKGLWWGRGVPFCIAPCCQALAGFLKAITLPCAACPCASRSASSEAVGL